MGLEVGWVDPRGDVVQHVLKMGQVGIVEGLHALDSHSVCDVDRSYRVDERKAPAKEALAEAELLIVSDGVGKY